MKRIFLNLCLLSLLSVILSSFCVATLGISPAIKEINFAPGQKYIWDYSVISDDPDKVVFISIDGDLAQYASLDKIQIIGAGKFRVSLNLPSNIEIPGQHTLAVNLEEEPSETQFIGVTIKISGLIRIFVPYPGRYAELALSTPDINVGEDIPVELQIINRGREPISLSNISINFVNSETNELIDNLNFNPVDLSVSEDRFFRKYLNTSEFIPGNYRATAYAYSLPNIWSMNQSFRVGNLFVNITNYTYVIYPNQGIQKFFVTLQSRWNGILSPVYIDVNLSSESITSSFRTPSVDLNPWETRNVESYFDASVLPVGVYNATFTAFYHGSNTTVFGKVSVENYNDYHYVIYASIGFGVIILIGLIVWIVSLRRKLHGKK